jgi:hypothetical protein
MEAAKYCLSQSWGQVDRQSVLVSSPILSSWPDFRCCLDSYRFVSVRRPLWREDGSVHCQMSWSIMYEYQRQTVVFSSLPASTAFPPFHHQRPPRHVKTIQMDLGELLLRYLRKMVVKKGNIFTTKEWNKDHRKEMYFLLDLQYRNYERNVI